MAHAFTISPTMLRVEALRQVRNPYTLAFTLAMPVGMYLLFGAGAAYGGMSAGHGNVRFYVMVSMAAYGAAVAMTSATSTAAVEAAQGWGRQLAMTPLRTAGYAATKLITALAAATLAVALVFVVGAATERRRRTDGAGPPPRFSFSAVRCCSGSTGWGWGSCSARTARRRSPRSR
jgi:ABC-2 type transport system permease protein